MMLLNIDRGYVIRRKDSEDFYGENMLNDWTLGESIGSARIFETIRDAKEILDRITNEGHITGEEHDIYRVKREISYEIY